MSLSTDLMNPWGSVYHLWFLSPWDLYITILVSGAAFAPLMSIIFWFISLIIWNSLLDKISWNMLASKHDPFNDPINKNAYIKNEKEKERGIEIEIEINVGKGSECSWHGVRITTSEIVSCESTPSFISGWVASALAGKDVSSPDRTLSKCFQT